MNFAGRTALVTGGARGIGEAIVGALAAEGASVAVCDLDLEGARAVADRVARETGVTAIGVHLDVAQRAAVVSALDEIEASLGPVDVLVNNAGIDVVKPFVESTEDEWDRIIAVNLRGPVNTCHVLLPGMIERERGAIVNLGSDAGRVGSSGEAVYSATKGGIIAFTKTLAREAVRYGIRVNCVCPGPTDTALLEQIGGGNPKLVESLTRAIPMRRVARPEEIARAVAFFASDDASYVTGQTLSVSGGLSMV
ncbi:MAG: SDR family NAD(P)-dependent oxidoreductase [Acidimicrobiia bacterium]